ncbi:hypothetical protein MBAV_001621 [Candidatus Magnetobacterium bavaricum]|uniref:Uncharacterized protein n=1 Tax=Candidatus Magnetobacterium bavaricum TaxID=29290 RepID=A0A0F3GW31_9BACT|nr:hypothetical protein MBAV_001621 [Candidatus Magnetobacterium bavaricum]
MILIGAIHIIFLKKAFSILVVSSCVFLSKCVSFKIKLSIEYMLDRFKFAFL